MTILSDIIGGSLLKAGGKIIDSVHTSDEERLAAQAVLRKLDIEEQTVLQKVIEAQIAVNLAASKHPSIFVSGARPAVIWICAAGLAWHYIGHDLFSWVAAVSGSSVRPPVLAGTEHLTTLIVGILGLGTVRTIEKIAGKARSSLKE